MDPKRLIAGVVGGLAGGVLFGLMMQMMGILGMVAGLVGQEAVGIGWVVHLGISALFGLIYAPTVGAASSSWGRAVGFGAVYGVIWWVLGALLIMPAMMGMPVLQLGTTELQSLVGHVVYGVALGVVFQAVATALADKAMPSRA